jgi:integrase
MTTKANQNSRKRGQHEGTFTYLAGRNLWMARIMLDLRRRSFYGKTRDEAARKVDAAKRMHKLGIDPDSKDLTLRQLLDQWLRDSEPLWAASTLAHHEYMVRVHLGPGLGRRTASTLTTSHVQSFFGDMLRQGHSTALVHHANRVLRACLNRAVKAGILERNVSTLIDLPAHRVKEKPHLSALEVQHVLSAARGDRLESLFTLGLSTGCRISELLGLQWDRVDLDSGTVHITRQLKSDKEGWFLGELKTERSRRHIEIGPTTVASLTAHRSRMAEEQLKLGPDWGNNLGLVFVTEFGTPIERRNLRRRNWKEIIERSGIDVHLTLHNMRDIFASLALGNGMNIVTVSAMLGHRDPSVTLQRYSYALPDSGREVANVMDQVIAAAG